MSTGAPAESRGRSAHGYLLTQVFGDPATAELVSPSHTVRLWVDVEKALAEAEAEVGLVEPEDAAVIASLGDGAKLDQASLWEHTRTVGYPILPLVRMLAAQLPDGPAGRLHFGATTQDVMDTALALQLKGVLDRLDDLLVQFGQEIAGLVAAHRDTVMAARTHGQQAVPTTFGAVLSGLLAEIGRHRARLADARPRIALVSLNGAGGTSAAIGEAAGRVRAALAGRLGLGVPSAVWHAARDGVAEVGWLCAAVSSTAARFATDVINLSRNEIGELAEGSGEVHYGASSTMPQKANPIRSEVVVGMSLLAGAVAAVLPRAMVVPHERAAGEWQAEWQAVPQLAELAAGALLNAVAVARSLTVDVDRMRHNAWMDGGFLMAEAFMMGLAGPMGREDAHDLVTAAVRRGRHRRETLVEALRSLIPTEQADRLEELVARLRPETYLGDAPTLCDRVLQEWKASVDRDREQRDERSAPWKN